MPKNINQIQKLIKQYDLKQQDVCKILNCSLDTVKSWLASPESNRFRKIPEFKYEYLEAHVRKNYYNGSTIPMINDMDSAEYHLENGINFLKGNKGEEALENLERALKDLKAAINYREAIGIQLEF